LTCIAWRSAWAIPRTPFARQCAALAVLERHGYSPVGYFVLDEACWLEAYYRPMQERFAGFLRQHDHIETAQAIVAQEENEIALYEKYRAFCGYGFYIAINNESR